MNIVAIVKGKREELQKKLRQIWDLSADLGLENDVVVSPMVIPMMVYAVQGIAAIL